MKRLPPADLFHPLRGIEPTRCSFRLTIISVARPSDSPRASLQSLPPPRSNECNGSQPQILAFLNEDRLVASAKQRAVAAMAPIESLGIDAVDVAHEPRKVSSRCSKTQMIVISHQTIREDFDSPQPVRLAQRVEEGLMVSVARKRRLSCCTPVHDVIHRIGKLDPQWTRHDLTIQVPP